MFFGYILKNSLESVKYMYSFKNFTCTFFHGSGFLADPDSGQKPDPDPDKRTRIQNNGLENTNTSFIRPNPNKFSGTALIIRIRPLSLITN